MGAGGPGIPPGGRSDATVASPLLPFFGGSVAVIHCDVTSSGERAAAPPGVLAGESTIGLLTVALALVDFQSSPGVSRLAGEEALSPASAAATAVSSDGRESRL